MTPVEIILGALCFLLLVVWSLPFLLTTINLLNVNSIKAPFGFHWLILFTGWWACQLILGLIAGVSGLLNAPVIFTLQGVFLVLALLWRKRIHKNRAMLSRSWMVPPRLLNTTEASTLFVLLLVLFFGTYLSLKSPTSNFDSLAYHLPVMANWVQQGSLWGFTEIGHVGLYPSHFELMSTLFFFPWNNGLMVGLPGLLAWVYSGLALYVFIRLGGVNPTAAVLGTALFMLLPDLVERLGAIQPDVVLVAVWFCFAMALIRWIKHRHILDFCFGIISVGLLLGMKLSAAGHWLLLVCIVGVYVWRTTELTRILPDTNRRWVWPMLVLSVVLAGSWYVRNMIQTGNPAGLVQVEFLGRVLFDGTLQRSELVRGSLARVFQIGSQQDWKIFGSALWLGLGPAGVFMFLLAGIGLLFRPKSGSLPHWIFLLLLMGEAVLYWIAPFSADNGSHDFQLTGWLINGLRYGYILVALLAVLAAKAIEKINPVIKKDDPIVEMVNPAIEELNAHAHWPALVLVVGCGLWSVKSMAMANPVALWVCIILALIVSLVLNFKGWPSARGMVWELGSGTLVLAVVAVVLFPAHQVHRAKLYGPVGQYLDDAGDNDAVMVVNSLELIRYAGPNWDRLVSVATPEGNISTTIWLRDLQLQGFRWLVVGTAEIDHQNDFVKQLIQDLDPKNSLVKLRLKESGLRQDERLYEIRKPGSAPGNFSRSPGHPSNPRIPQHATN